MEPTKQPAEWNALRRVVAQLNANDLRFLAVVSDHSSRVAFLLGRIFPCW